MLLTGQGHVYKGLVFQEVVKHGCDITLVVVPAQTKVLAVVVARIGTPVTLITRFPSTGTYRSGRGHCGRETVCS